MKKLICLLISLSIIMPTFFACSKTDNGEEAVDSKPVSFNKEAITSQTDNGNVSNVENLKNYLIYIKDEDSEFSEKSYYYEIPNDTCSDVKKHNNYEYKIHENNCVEIVRYLGNDSSVKIPEEINGNPVRYIGESAFAEHDIESYNDNAVYSLSSIEIPNTVIFIGEGAFYFCALLSKVVLSENLIYIGTNAFSNCSNLKDIKFPESLEVIDNCAFEECTNITSVVFPENLKIVRSTCFFNCISLKNVTLNNNIEYVGASSFAQTAIEKITIPNSLTRISSNLFGFCKNLKTVNFEKDRKSSLIIENLAFIDCKSLEKVDFPYDTKEIQEEAFSGCSKLKNVYFKTSDCNIGNSSFSGCMFLRIHAPAGGNIEKFCSENLLLKFVPES